MELFLIRHGESTWNRMNKIQGYRDPHLSKLGRQQSEFLGRRLKGCKFDALYSSSLRRARQTAEYIANGLQITFCEGLREICLGEWEGRRVKDFDKENQKLFTQWLDDPWSVEIKGAESMSVFEHRVKKVFDWIQNRHFGQRVCVVTHGGVISIFLLHILSMSRKRLWSIFTDNASLTIVRFSHKRPSLYLFNDTCHLNHLGNSSSLAI